jgi:hypothetical protein
MNSRIKEYVERGRKLVDCIEQGKKLVKPFLKDEWATCAMVYEESIGAALAVMIALSKGRTPEKAEEETQKYSLSTDMKTQVADTIYHFHPRGDEFRQYLNQKIADEEMALQADTHKKK